MRLNCSFPNFLDCATIRTNKAFMRSIGFLFTTTAFVAVQMQIMTATASPLQDGPFVAPENPNSLGRKLEELRAVDIVKLEKFFGVKMEAKLKSLPTSAIHQPLPWNGPSWLVNQDSINYEWKKGQPSPAEKYATAFGLNVKDFMDKVSAQNGIDSRMNSSTPCTSNSDCEYAICAIRTNATSGYCIDSWYGLSHALAPASVLEKEPVCAVSFNGVVFRPTDIKGLITAIYDDVDVPNVFTGVRDNGNNDSVDAYGRSVEYSYRDLNPGFFHIAATNLLGKFNRTFIIDRNANYIVWNQPAYGFEVYEQTGLTLQEAARTFYQLEAYPWNSNATSIVHIKSNLLWNNGTDVDDGYGDLTVPPDSGMSYEYLLELDEAEEIIGGEWLNTSIDNHPDFLWFPEGKPAADVVTSLGLSYANVTMLLEKAAACNHST